MTATDCDRSPIRSIGDLHRVARHAGGYWISFASSLYLLLFIIPAWVFSPGVGAVAVTGVCLLIAAVHVLSGGARMLPERGRWLYVGLMVFLMLVLTPLVGWNVLFGSVFVSMTIAVVLDWTVARRLLLGVFVVYLALSLFAELWFAAAVAAAGVVMSLAVGVMIRQGITQEKLDAAERRNSALAVAAERERIGRDLHDILGHSLTVIAMNAQVAQRLSEQDPTAARERMAAVETTARQALADVRATASTMRQVRLASELSSARSVLVASDIRAETPASLPALDDATSEALGYAVREVVTNVVRHAGAATCTITIGESDGAVTLSVRDDGVGLAAARKTHHQDGTGLDGLGTRLSAVGGSITAEDAGPGTAVTATVPAAHDRTRDQALRG